MSDTLDILLVFLGLIMGIRTLDTVHRWFRIGGSCQVADADNADGAEAAAGEASIQAPGGGHGVN